ncbi:MAG TPA: PfkB family carbohydrate kinase [Gaiellaceae bacterium]|jgi:sugar/nucleoside kinase (ribokinase family)
MRPVAVIGQLARDLFVGQPPRIGGGPWHAARALRALGRPAAVAAKCGVEDRRAYLSQLSALGLPVTLAVGERTTAFTFRYEAGRRVMGVEAIGEPWGAREALCPAVRTAGWVHVAPLLRSDFPVETLAALAAGRRLLLDGQGLVRVPREGPLELDRDFDPRVLQHISILKLAEEEALVVLDRLDVREIAALAVPEVLVTLGEAGSLVYSGGRLERVAARAIPVEATGAGDGFCVAYLLARSEGHAPASAARRATALVAAVLDARRQR